MTKYFNLKHVVQDPVDTEQEKRSSDSHDIERSYGDDNLENDEDVGDLCEANICKIKTLKVKRIEWINCQTCSVWLHFSHFFCCDLEKPQKNSTLTLVVNFKLCLFSRIFFLFLDFFLRTFTNHWATGEGRGYFFNSSLPLPPASQAFRH